MPCFVFTATKIFALKMQSVVITTGSIAFFPSDAAHVALHSDFSRSWLNISCNINLPSKNPSNSLMKSPSHQPLSQPLSDEVPKKKTTINFFDIGNQRSSFLDFIYNSTATTITSLNMAYEEMNDQQQNTPSSNPVYVEEDPVKEAIETEGKRPSCAGGNLFDPNSPPNSGFAITPASLARAHIPPLLSLTDLIRLLPPAIESWLHSHTTELLTFLLSTTLSIPGFPNNPSRPPRPPKPPIPPAPKSTATSDERQRIQQAPPPGDGLPSDIGAVNLVQKLEAGVKILNAEFDEMNIVTEDMVTEVDLEDLVSKLKGKSDDKLKAEVVKKAFEGQGEIASDDKILDELKEDDFTSQEELKDANVFKVDLKYSKVESEG